MPDFRCEYAAGGVHLPELGLWLDRRRSCPGPERVFVSHAHSDHIGRHREVILTDATSKLMALRMPSRQRTEHRLPWRTATSFVGPRGAWSISLHPAGHILGSAMALVESEGARLLYTGDFRLRPGPGGEACEPVAADLLIMETTFGRPRYVFPPVEEIVAGIVGFCRATLDRGETPVLLGYALGKCQEVLMALAGCGLPIALHPHAVRLTRVYAECGCQLPEYTTLSGETRRGVVVVCPPGAQHTEWVRSMAPLRTAVLTGWAMDSGCRFRYGADEAFPLSDHADYPDLLEFVRRVQPRRVLTLHGFAADFAATLRRAGTEAWALSETNQLELPLPA